MGIKTLKTMMMRKCFFYVTAILVVLQTASCRKSTSSDPGTPLPTPPPQSTDTLAFGYGDSILYVSPSNDRLVLPVNNRAGHYTGFPEGIELDPTTGAINVNESETGLRYRITFFPDGSNDTLSTQVVLSGISYLDQVYHLDEDDTLAMPVYNARFGDDIPGTNGQSVFDEGGGCKAEGIVVNQQDALINLAQTVRNGVFGDEPKNGAQKEVEMLYRLSDKSGKSLNKLKVKLYYFDSPDKITADLVAEMNNRRGMFLGLQLPPFLSVDAATAGTPVISSNSTLANAKPRPPCIFLTGKVSKR